MSGKRYNNRRFDGALIVTSKANRISRKAKRHTHKREGYNGR